MPRDKRLQAQLCLLDLGLGYSGRLRKIRYRMCRCSSNPCVFVTVPACSPGAQLGKLGDMLLACGLQDKSLK